MRAASASSTRGIPTGDRPGPNPTASPKRSTRDGTALTRSSPRSPATTLTTAARQVSSATIAAIRRRDPGIRVEVLIPDCKGDADALDARSSTARPDVAEPQHRDGGAPAASGAAVGRLRAQPRRARPRQGRRTDDEVGPHRRHGGDATTRCWRRSPTCAAVGVDIVTHRPVPAPDDASPSGRPLVDAR